MPRELTYEQKYGEKFNHCRFGTKWTYEQWMAAHAITDQRRVLRTPVDSDDFTDMLAQRNLLLKALEGMVNLFGDYADTPVLEARAAIVKVRPL